MKAVFLDYATFSQGLDISSIEQVVDELTFYQYTQPSEVLDRAKNADIIITNKVILDQAILAQLPKLKLICVAATGTNNIDLQAAKAHSITVTNASNYAGPAVAQYIFSQLLALFQGIEHHNDNVQQGLWSKSPSFCLHGNPINELFGKSIGILGYGHIGQAVAQIAQAFGMEVIISEQPNAKQVRSSRVSFEEMLTNADIISLHCPFTEETEGLINEAKLKRMKDNAILINTARGGLIDNQALKSALTNRIIGHAILDVLDQEPPAKDHLLLSSQLENLTITAHIAWASQQAQQRLLDIIGKNIQQYLYGTPINQVN